MASPVPLRIDPDVPLRTQFGFGRIVCAVNDCRCSQEAVHQATQLLRPGDTLSFIAVVDAHGVSPAGHATLDERAPQRRSRPRARLPMPTVSRPAPRSCAGRTSTGAILEAAHEAGLLVVGAHGHGASLKPRPVPALVARSRPELPFPGVVLVGTRGAEDRHAAVVAANIVAAHDSRVVLAHAGRTDSALRQALAEQAADVLEITGKDPVVVSVDGPPLDRLLGMASSIGASLVVLGGHGRHGPAGAREPVGACGAARHLLGARPFGELQTARRMITPHPVLPPEVSKPTGWWT